MTQQVTYSLAVKRALPEYQNFSPFYSVTEDVREDETPDEAFDRLEDLVERRMGLKIPSLESELTGG
jgi:hypothetical protein